MFTSEGLEILSFYRILEFIAYWQQIVPVYIHLLYFTSSKSITVKYAITFYFIYIIIYITIIPKIVLPI